MNDEVVLVRSNLLQVLTGCAPHIMVGSMRTFSVFDYYRVKALVFDRV